MKRRTFLWTTGALIGGATFGLYADNLIKDSNYIKKFQEIYSEIDKNGEIWGPKNDPVARQKFLRTSDFDGDGKNDFAKGKIRYLGGDNLMFIEADLTSRKKVMINSSMTDGKFGELNIGDSPQPLAKKIIDAFYDSIVKKNKK